MTGVMRAALLPLGLAVLAGCGGEDDRPAAFRYIHAAILEPNCTTSSCHTDQNEQAGVELHDPEVAYSILVGASCDGEPPEQQLTYVAPGDPDGSLLVRLLTGESVPQQMPPDRPLPPPDIELVERWILDGALCN